MSFDPRYNSENSSPDSSIDAQEELFQTHRKRPRIQHSPTTARNPQSSYERHTSTSNNQQKEQQFLNLKNPQSFFYVKSREQRSARYTKQEEQVGKRKRNGSDGNLKSKSVSKRAKSATLDLEFIQQGAWEIEFTLAIKSKDRKYWKKYLSQINTQYISNGSIFQSPKTNHTANNDTIETRYLIKWSGLSHLHLSWETKEDLMQYIGAISDLGVLNEEHHEFNFGAPARIVASQPLQKGMTPMKQLVYVEWHGLAEPTWETLEDLCDSELLLDFIDRRKQMKG